MPSAIDMATVIIKEHPECFKEDVQTKLLIVKLMHDYKNAYLEWANPYSKQDENIGGSLFESFANIVRDDAIVSHGIDLSKIDEP